MKDFNVQYVIIKQNLKDIYLDMLKMFIKKVKMLFALI